MTYTLHRHINIARACLEGYMPCLQKVYMYAIMQISLVLDKSEFMSLYIGGMAGSFVIP